MMLNEALVGSGRAAFLIALRIAPRRADGMRSFLLRWRERRRYENVEPEERQIQGDIRLET